MISVVLVEPETAGNIGSIARAMKNFDFEDLLLINPKCSHLSHESFKRAKHASNVLRKAKIADFSVLGKFDFVIGTTSKKGTDYNINRSFTSPVQLAKKLSRVKGNIAIVFGRESTGLRNEELLKCDTCVVIPSSKKYPALNVAASATILFYEIFKEKKSEGFALMSAKDKKVMLQKIDKIIKNMFEREKERRIQKLLWRRIIGKAMLTRREAFSLFGFLRKIG